MKQFKAGHLYVAAFRENGWTRYEGLYWFGGDGQWYDADANINDSSYMEAMYPEHDEMVEQFGEFHAEFAALSR